MLVPEGIVESCDVTSHLVLPVLSPDQPEGKTKYKGLKQDFVCKFIFKRRRLNPPRRQHPFVEFPREGSAEHLLKEYHDTGDQVRSEHRQLNDDISGVVFDAGLTSAALAGREWTETG